MILSIYQNAEVIQGFLTTTLEVQKTWLLVSNRNPEFSGSYLDGLGKI